MAKKLPKQLQTNSDKINRGKELSRSSDVFKNKAIGIMDIDQSLYYYFENVIKPVVEENGEQVKVPVIYANPERWAAIQKQGFIRDNKRKIMTPVISYRRTSLSKDESIPVDKLDPLNPKLFTAYQSRYTQENRYDKLTATKGLTPKKEMFNVAIPDYVTLSYDFIIWTSFTDQMNQIVEKINWSEGSYWGEPGKFRFRAAIDSFNDASEYEGTRKIKTEFSVTLHGYLVPDSFNNIVTTQKFITPKQIVISDETDINVLPITDIDSDGAKSIRVVTNLGGSGGGSGGGGSVSTLTISPGPNMNFNAFAFNGISPLTATLKLSDTPTFNALSVTSSVAITGSMHVSASVTSSTAITTNNITNGYPTSNAWQEGLDGSYFDNFDHNSHVSEVLRFMAGIISHSLDTASPTSNTRTYGSVDTNNNNLGSTANQISGRLPQNYTALNNDTLGYLVSKGWTSVGAKVFDGISIYNDDDYFVDFDSNSGGSTTISSSADSELFGLGPLTSGGATRFDVKVIATQSFSDSVGLTTPTAVTNSFTTQSIKDYAMTSFGTTSGVTLAKIESANPAVIPAAYQDGKFANIGGNAMSGSLSRKYHATKGDFSNISSSGYYNFHDLKVGISTGSGNYTFVNGTNKKYFYAPRTAINTAIGDNSIDDSGFAYKELTCVSRSLSGAPYATGSTYEASSKVTGLFNPLYAGTTTLVDFVEHSVGMGSVTVTNGTISTNGGTIQTTNAIYDSTGATVRGTGTVPYYNDIAIVSASIKWDAGNDENINQGSGTGDTSFNIKVNVRDRDSDQSTVKTQNLKYHTAGAFGQTAASGSMAVYGRPNGYDPGSLTGTSETFFGESFRIQLLNNVQAFNGTAWNTAYAINQLGTYDLQIKPGFLVDPGGQYRYWYPTNYNSGGTYKYYIRRFQTSGTKSSMTVNVGTSLVAWNATTNGVSVALLFKSSGNGSGNRGGAGSLGTARIFDPSATTTNLIEANVANDNHKNPFSSEISLYGNTGGSISGTTYTVPLRNADSMFIDNSDNEIYVIIRYKGDPSPVTSTTISYS